MMHEGMEEKLVEELKKIGLDEDMMSYYVLWGSYKIALGSAKVMHGLKEKGMAEDEAKKIAQKIFDTAMEKDLDHLIDEHEHKHHHCC